ncbi:ABC transporter permease [Lacticaseibacillus paracasei]|uniref:ABC transporter permease n=1 Tax=Lacticaseibacillus paracasei TaxID=1597 RepID=UPI000FF0C4D3|nr:ABC transporter permease [Lacticaseibacillus paracasei]RWZ62952.1 ABC transporter permease [Lacticaseibacillus paracasei]
MMRLIAIDYRERTQQFSFRILAVIALFAAVILAPRPRGNFRVLVLDPQYFAQANNPTWLPIGVACVLSLFFPLVSLVVARQGIHADRENGVLTYLLTTKLRRVRYLASQFLVSCCLLFTILVLVMLGSGLMLLIQYPGQGLSLSQFLSPFFSLVPGIFLISGLGVLSETLPGLRGQLGTTVLVIALLTLYAMMTTMTWYSQLFNFSGIASLMAMIRQSAISAGHPLNTVLMLGDNDHLSRMGTHQLIFQPLALTQTEWLAIGGTVLMSIVLVLLAAFCLDHRPLHQKTNSGKSKLTVDLPRPKDDRFHSARTANFRWQQLLGQQAHRLFHSQNKWWWLVAMGLWLLAWVVPVGSLRGMILPIQYLWAMSFFSQIGWPDDLNGLSAWEGTVNHATRRAINSTLWLSVTFSLLLLLPTLLRQGIVAWPLLGWAIMLPVVSLMLGQLTKSGQWSQLLGTVILFLVVCGLTGPLPLATSIVGMVTGAVYSLIAVGCWVVIEVRAR